MTSRPLDVRVWLVWGSVMMISALMIRNPIVLLELLVVALSVRLTCVPRHRRQGWAWFLRLTAIMASIGVIFNALTVHAGDRILVTLPSAWPVIGGEITLNAIAYGVVSTVAFVTLILIGTTLAAVMNWVELTRVLPRRLAPFAVAGSVAWAFLPQLGVALRDIRETQIARGQPMQGRASLLALIVPLLGGGLDRAMTTAEALEARGFGVQIANGDAPKPRPEQRSGFGIRRAVMLLGLTGLLLAAYSLAVGAGGIWGWLVIPGGGCVFAGLRGSRGPGPDAGATRYRQPVWTWRESAILFASIVAMFAIGFRWIADASLLRFDPYPSLTWPGVDLIAMLAAALLVLPVLIVPVRFEEYP
jgi:energy-coupling factor transport system permease protein